MKVSLGGTVTVAATELWYSEIRAGRAFTFQNTNAASVGNFSPCQLFNPVGSAVRVIVFGVVGSASVASVLELRAHNAALATLSGNGTNLLQGGAVSVAEVRIANPAASPGTAFFIREVQAAVAHDMVLYWVYEMAANRGLVLVPSIVNTTLRTTFRWIEVPA